MFGNGDRKRMRLRLNIVNELLLSWIFQDLKA